MYAAIGKKPPPAPGCVDQQLTSLTLNSNSVHTELDIPPAPADTPYALQILLDMYRAQFLQMVEIMKSPRYRDDVNLQIERDKVRCKGGCDGWGMYYEEKVHKIVVGKPEGKRPVARPVC